MIRAACMSQDGLNTVVAHTSNLTRQTPNQSSQPTSHSSLRSSCAAAAERVALGGEELAKISEDLQKRIGAFILKDLSQSTSRTLSSGKGTEGKRKKG